MFHLPWGTVAASPPFFFRQINIRLFQLLRFFGKDMHQYDLIKHLKEIEDTVLVRTVAYSQFSYFSSDKVSIGSLEVWPLFFQEGQIGSHLGPCLFVQAVKKIIERRIASLSGIEDQIVQAHLRAMAFIYIMFDVLSSDLLPFALSRFRFGAKTAFFAWGTHHAR
jgi:hypothetical protein